MLSCLNFNFSHMVEVVDDADDENADQVVFEQVERGQVGDFPVEVLLVSPYCPVPIAGVGVGIVVHQILDQVHLDLHALGGPKENCDEILL